jgi:hypothetical protein
VEVASARAGQALLCASSYSRAMQIGVIAVSFRIEKARFVGVENAVEMQLLLERIWDSTKTSTR